MRLTLAKEARVAAFVILPDMVHLKPWTPDQIRMVHGIGEAKMEKYGDIFLEAIRAHLDE